MADLSPTIGHIDNIPIQLHWSFILLLFVILLLSLYLFIVWILLFVCVLVHELFHSITSKRNGIKVNKIVLYPFGGGSMIDFEKVNPEIEFRISVVGPIASLLIAMLFGIATLYVPAGQISSTVQILFLLNIFLGVFNLLPWLPLDGGRALRSYLQKSRNFIDATKIAVKSSNVVTVLFVAGTIVYAIFAHGYSTLYREFIVLWDVAIAFFIYSGAQAEMQNALVKEGVSDLKAKDAITKNYMVVSKDTKVRNLYKTIIKNKIHIILFRKDDQIKILSNSALQKMLKKSSGDITIENLGITIPNIPYNANLYGAIESMRSAETSIAAVTKSNEIIGVLLTQHIESIIALHISQRRDKNQAPAKD